MRLTFTTEVYCLSITLKIMKFFPNLASGLRTVFGTIRLLILVLGVFWLIGISLAGFVSSKANPSERGPILNTAAQVVLDLPAVSIPVGTNVDQPGSVALGNLRGDLRLDSLSRDPAVVATLRRTAFPTVFAMTLFGWFFFGYLRAVCANLERGEVFTDRSFQAIRGVGISLIVYGVVDAVLKLWASQVIADFIHGHVATSVLRLGAVQLRFSQMGYVSATTTVVSGAFVLLMSEAFRQGLAMKAENDLTV